MLKKTKLNSLKYCPICNEKRTHIGLTRKYLESGFFLFPDILCGIEIVRKCDNNHYWTKRWQQVAPLKKQIKIISFKKRKEVPKNMVSFEIDGNTFQINDEEFNLHLDVDKQSGLVEISTYNSTGCNQKTYIKREVAIILALWLKTELMKEESGENEEENPIIK